MTIRLLSGAALGLALSAAALSTPALAQSYNAPAGIPAATAPGGLEGRAAQSNFFDARERAARVETPYGVGDDVVTGSLRRPDAYPVYRGR